LGEQQCAGLFYAITRRASETAVVYAAVATLPDGPRPSVPLATIVIAAPDTAR
jgi:hypothetical protein